MALVAARAIEQLRESAPGLGCRVLMAGYGEPAATFDDLFEARKP